MSRQATHLAGVLGWPLKHTLSPTIHNAAFRRLDMDWIYLPFPVPPASLEQAIGGARALGLRGLNVTMPHKRTVVTALDGLSGDAAILGTVNTIQEIGGRLIGHNTDVDGFKGFLRDDAGLDVDGKDALILGAGGAARAVLRSLDELGAGRIVVACRDPEKAQWAGELSDRATVVGWPEAVRAADVALIVNATPLGMGGEAVLPKARFHPGQAVVDLTYGPENSPLVVDARAQGADAWGGLGMLVHQAVASFRIWTGQDPPVQVMSAAAVHALGGLRHKKDTSNPA